MILKNIFNFCFVFKIINVVCCNAIGINNRNVKLYFQEHLEIKEGIQKQKQFNISEETKKNGIKELEKT